MMSLRELGAIGLVALLAACQTGPFPALENPPAQADAPRLAVGDTWIYRHTDGYTRLPLGTYTHTISALDGDVVTVQVTAEDGRVVGSDRFTRDWNWLDKPMTNLQRFRYAPAYRAFQFPLRADSRWSVQMRVTDVAAGSSYTLARVDGRVDGWKRVTVPAGTFDAVAVHRAAYSGVETFDRTQEYIVENDWYASAVNNVVAGSYRSEYRDKTQNGDEDNGWRSGAWTQVELIEYRPARK